MYLSVQGADANGASVFTPTTSLSVNGVGYTLAVSTVSGSLNGAAVQSIESIRANAHAFAAQQRLVTADDYKAIIQKTLLLLWMQQLGEVRQCSCKVWCCLC